MLVEQEKYNIHLEKDEGNLGIYAIEIIIDCFSFFMHYIRHILYIS